MKRFKQFLEEKSTSDYIPTALIPTVNAGVNTAIQLQQFWNNFPFGDLARSMKDDVLDLADAITDPGFTIIDYNNIPTFPVRLPPPPPPPPPPPSPPVGGGGVGQQHGTPGY